MEKKSNNLQKELYAKRLNRKAFFRLDQRQGMPSLPPFLITFPPELYTFPCSNSSSFLIWLYGHKDHVFLKNSSRRT